MIASYKSGIGKDAAVVLNSLVMFCYPTQVRGIALLKFIVPFGQCFRDSFVMTSLGSVL
jgi:hypothetical protein